MKVSMFLAGRAFDPDVLAVHISIEGPLRDVFGGQSPLGWSPFPAGPLAHVRAYWVDGDKGPFFHYLGWGLTEMGPKYSSLADTSGFGIELTLKIRAFPEERVSDPGALPAQNAPRWPAELLGFLARSIQRSGRPFGHDHWIQAGEQGFGPENLRHLACAFDDVCGPIQTQNGQFRYLQIYSIDEGELLLFKEAETSGSVCSVLARRKALDPDLVIARRR
jgi:hypothetical protein